MATRTWLSWSGGPLTTPPVVPGFCNACNLSCAVSLSNRYILFWKASASYCTTFTTKIFMSLSSGHCNAVSSHSHVMGIAGLAICLFSVCFFANEEQGVTMCIALDLVIGLYEECCASLRCYFVFELWGETLAAGTAAKLLTWKTKQTFFQYGLRFHMFHKPKLRYKTCQNSKLVPFSKTKNMCAWLFLRKQRSLTVVFGPFRRILSYPILSYPSETQTGRPLKCFASKPEASRFH